MRKSNKTMSIRKALGDGLHNVAKFKPDEIARFLNDADNEYYNGDGSVKVTDDVYDHVKSYLAKMDPSNAVLTKVGAPIAVNDDVREKVELPAYMGSLKKIKKQADLEKWYEDRSNQQVVSDKLDGVSGLLVYGQGDDDVQLFTRGDGKVGENASFLLEYIRNVPFFKGGQGVNPLMVRGELIMSTTSFNKVNQMGHSFKNPRALVSGAVNAVKVRRAEVLREIQFIAYELVELPTSRHPSEQFAMLHEMGFKVVPHQTMNKPDSTVLSEYLMKRRMETEFEMDGVVVVDNVPYIRSDGENPTYAFAFKDMATHERAEALVTSVDWIVSKDGLLKPTVLIEPVSLAGMTIAKATGFNAKFIHDIVVGPGAKVIIVRSGDVIPHIVEVVSPALQGVAMMPAIDWAWNDTNVDIKVTEDSDDLHIKRLTYFFDKIGARGVSESTITKLYQHGFTTVGRIKDMIVPDVINIQGFKEKSATNVVNAIADALKKASVIDIMVASNAFGRGLGAKKLEAFMTKMPELQGKPPSLWQTITTVQGGTKSFDQFVTNLNVFINFVEENNLY